MYYKCRDLLAWSVERLTEARIENPRLDGELLVAYSLNCDRIRIFMEPDRNITRDEFVVFKHVLERRINREPIHYILNFREFWSRTFVVSPEVLIPRPETELIIRVLLKLNKGFFGSRAPAILDIGTGSGNLAITAFLEVSDCRVTALDVSEEALKVAKYNAIFQNVGEKIQFQLGDVFKDQFFEMFLNYDYILCNPPYIPSAQIPNLMQEVKNFEPHQAIDGGYDGLKFYRHLISKVKGCLKPGGYLIFEIGDGQSKAVSGLLSQFFETSELVCDYAGQPRVAFAKKQSNGQN